MYLNYLLKSNKNLYPQESCTQMSIAVLPIVVSNCKHIKCPSTREWRSKLCDKMKCYSWWKEGCNHLRLNFRNTVLDKRSRRGKKYLLNESIYMKLKNRQDQSISFRVRAVVIFCDWELVGTKCKRIFCGNGNMYYN